MKIQNFANIRKTALAPFAAHPVTTPVERYDITL